MYTCHDYPFNQIISVSFRSFHFKVNNGYVIIPEADTKTFLANNVTLTYMTHYSVN